MRTGSTLRYLCVAVHLIGIPVLASAATFSVTKVEDTADGACAPTDCSLREAIIAANADSIKDTIALKKPGTYLLTIPDTSPNGDEGEAKMGDLDILQPVLIKGLGANQTIIDGNKLHRIFHNFANGTQIINVTIANGHVSGADPRGGGVINSPGGSLSLSDSKVVNNQAQKGGGIFTAKESTLKIFHSTIANNIGQGLWNNGGTVTIDNTTIRENIADEGSGYYQVGDKTPLPSVKISNTIFLNNQAQSATGGSVILIQNGGTLELLRSTIQGNSGSTLIGPGAKAVLVDSAVIGNSHSGIIVYGGSLSLTSSTIANNTGTGLSCDHAGSSKGELVITNSTITLNNTAKLKDAAGLFLFPKQVNITLLNSIIAGNKGWECFQWGDDSSTGTSGHNVIGALTKCNWLAPSDTVGASPVQLFGPFLPSTVPGKAHYPLLPQQDNLAVGKAVNCPITDQLGQTRIGPCDAGAVESDRFCGDGDVMNPEQCDDGNQNNQDGCLNTCKKAVCGDGVVQTGVEACDDGNQFDNDGCSGTCSSAHCGNGTVEEALGEVCDDGNTITTDGCLTSCLAAKCGDGIVRTGVEACDDGNDNNTDACLVGCTVAKCGDGHVRQGIETCDDGNTIAGDGCSADCARQEICGDGVTDPQEECDQGPSNGEAGSCLPGCKQAKCGDGFVRSGKELCDDGNAINNDTCTNTCQSPTCGDGIVQQANGETCDDGNSVNTDTCLNICAAAICGDGVVQAGVEACDDGNDNNTDACLVGCTVAKCGDGHVRQGIETCDDGNGISGDGCDGACVVEQLKDTPPLPTGGGENVAPTQQLPPKTTDTTGPNTQNTTGVQEQPSPDTGGCSLVLR